MKYDQNLHTHTNFSDGKDQMEDMVKHAIKIGFTSIGFSDHANMGFEVSGAMTVQNAEKSLATSKALQQKYKGQISVYCGLENDLFSKQDLSPYDYVIGSCHCLVLGGEVIEFDGRKEHVKSVIDRFFDGNGLKFAKCYYDNFSLLANTKRIDIVGHADLVTKHSENVEFFNQENGEYKDFAVKAIRKVFERCKVFEVNSGAIARGYRTTPYPAPFIMEELKNLGAKMIISSDCHNKDFLDCNFEKSLAYVKDFGFNKIYKFDGKDFIPFDL